MARQGSATGEARRQARRAAREASPWIERLGRLGYAAKGIVYALVGVLALQAALGTGGATTDTQGALERIVRAPFGRVLLAIVALGLAGYALWRFVQAGLDTDNKGADAKGVVTRGAYAVIGAVYVGLALSAARLVLGGAGGGGGDAAAQGWTGRLLARPFGQWLVGLAGVVVIGIGVYQLSRGYRAAFREELKLGEMSAAEEEWATRAGRIGHAALGVVSGIIGAFLIVAARQARPEEARGLAGALAALAARPYGPWLLGVVAIGLIAYGGFMLVEARYRRMVIA